MTLEKNRINSIDLLRGLIMIVMALDHTRDFFHVAAFQFTPTDLTKTTPAIFFTRWITHFCAPAFALLSGISISINMRKKGRSEMVKYLLSRGLWLVLLDLTVLRFGFFFNFYYDLTFLSILWMLGLCMMFMAAVVLLPNRVTLVLAVIIIFGHDIFSAVNLDEINIGLGSIWKVLMTVGFIPPAFVTAYPIIPWLGIMMLGYCVGRWYGEKYDPLMRRRLLMQLGILCMVLFLFLRWVNVYGDPNPWSVDSERPLFTFLSFLNVTKNPVSLLYTLMTLGPLFVLLPWFESVRASSMTRWLSPAVVFGRVPLFYFLLHFYLIHATGLIVNMWRSGRSWSEVDLHFSAGFGGIIPAGGVSLMWAYVAWVVIVMTLYPVCSWYDNYKRTHRHWWLSYL
jgi:uncharacterized membrane protein